MKKLFVYGLASLLLWSCRDDSGLWETNDQDPNIHSNTYGVVSNTRSEAAYVAGQIYICVSESSLRELKVDRSGILPMNSIPSMMSKALSNIRAHRIERLFPDAGIYEARSRKMGMHKWFKVYFDESVSCAEACQTMSSVPTVEYSEAIPKMIRPTSKVTPISEKELSKLMAEAPEMPFNDPMLPQQWHYNNTGRILKSEAGADVNLFPAWKIQTGKPNVLVAIVDGGIDIEHEDLVDNLFVNQAEKNGQEGVDDDGNGWIDDVYGYNFITMTPLIEPDDMSHGTHVAGTVAARSNNGVGVAGVAGGDGSANSGVRLISCQIFRKPKEGGDAPRAIKYGADAGAVISQNSWGYEEGTIPDMPRALQLAIDYFRKNAGCDENGNQRPDSPMKGGVLFFATGNEGKDFREIPASYDKVISVSAMSCNFSKAQYTNRGDWVTIMAPGGATYYGHETAGVLSTLSPKSPMAFGEKYGYMQGTSMACPHVSGIAALVVSQMGRQGFTNEMLESIIKSALKDVDINEKNPGFEGRLGLGYIDAYRALVNKNQNKAPNAPNVIWDKINSAIGINELSLYWTISSDEDDVAPSYFKVYRAEEELTENNYEAIGSLMSFGTANYLSVMGRKVGDELSLQLRALKSNVTYYFAIVAIDRWGLKSTPALLSVKTKLNTPPVVSGIPEGVLRIRNTANEHSFVLTVTDPDRHTWTMDKSHLPKGVTARRGANKGVDDDKVYISIRPVLEPGAYELPLSFIDQLRGKTDISIPFKIYRVESPKVAMPIDNQLLGLDNPSVVLDISQVFTYDTEEPVAFTATSSDSGVATVSLQEQRLTLRAGKEGKATISLVASNGITAPTTVRFEVRVVKQKNIPVYSIYPIPTRDNLNIWLNPEVKTATLTFATLSGEQVRTATIAAGRKGVATLDISSFVPGVYRLAVKTSRGEVVRTIVKK